MAIVLPLEAQTKRTKKTKKARAVRPSASVEKAYREALRDLAGQLDALTTPISNAIGRGASAADIGALLQGAISTSDRQIDQVATPMASQVVAASSAQNKTRMQNVIKSALGVEFATILDTPELKASLNLSIAENVSLIKSIGAEHWSKVIRAVTNNFAGVPLEGNQSLTARLQDIGKISENKATLIARDQTGKLNSSLTTLRHDDLNINSYIWRTARDERVVGNPTGLYPKGNRTHGDHFDREGRIYYYSAPPADGNPGFPINCRCFAESRIDIDALNAVYV